MGERPAMTGAEAFAALVAHAPVRVERTTTHNKSHWTVTAHGGRGLLRTLSDRATEREIADAVAVCVNATVRALA